VATSINEDKQRNVFIQDRLKRLRHFAELDEMDGGLCGDIQMKKKDE
jgi:hypothetical protein